MIYVSLSLGMMHDVLWLTLLRFKGESTPQIEVKAQTARVR
jgi:hypothetical protein